MRVPFLYNTVRDIQQEYKNKEELQILQLQSEQELSATDRNLIYSKVNEQLIINDLCLSLGLKCSVFQCFYFPNTIDLHFSWIPICVPPLRAVGEYKLLNRQILQQHP